ncbi:transcription-repair coupling factor [Flavobacteriaceae bacterium]|nr:transcription-repair coupling factor [Flavobacteriaceae bacterium]MDC1491975.1 transcription-repair coupling factor [Flavobacteriaceae bacterium]
MSDKNISHHFVKSLQTQKLENFISKNENNILLKGLVGSSLSFVVSSIFSKTKTSTLFILENKETAAYHFNDLEKLNNSNIVFYPESYKNPYMSSNNDNSNILLRADVLNKINSSPDKYIVVTYYKALFEKVVTKLELQKNTLKIKVADELSIDFINEILFEYEFSRVDFVTQPGDFSVRGGIIDVFSFSNDKPYRIEFFGDEITRIRSFDLESQLSISSYNEIKIIPNIQSDIKIENRINFLDILPSHSIIFLKNSKYLLKEIKLLFDKSISTYKDLSNVTVQLKPQELFSSSKEIKSSLIKHKLVEIGSNSIFNQNVISYVVKPQPSFNKSFELLIENLNNYSKLGFTNYLCCANEQQQNRFSDIFDNLELDVNYIPVILPLYQGFIDNDNKIICYTDHQIFDRYHKYKIKDVYAKKQALNIKELTKLKVGDFITHIDHGIGKFGGLKKINVEGKMQESIKLIYGERDTLYLSIHSLHKITKYNSKDGKAPKIYKLGSKAWKILKQKTRTKVKVIAYDLIKLYAKRKNQKGFQYSTDSYLQHELEASFIYEDTPDQLSSTIDVKNDMESIRPMDRLICGDVGFGKTEIAIRAAFKAVDNNKQVAILVPTTILAFQHYKTFSSRLSDFPVSIDYLNRFRNSSDKKNILEELSNGKIDIIIGTHQIVNKNINFKDLGLLIVDEEQKFGVSIKEKLKNIKENVDVLTLSATPIPRTLQFSLMAARDLSIINTAPPNRYPISSEVIRFSETIIRDAITLEILRGGQVFFIHNRIENINEVAGLIQRLVPEAKIQVGHGRLEGKKLEQLMLDFMEGSFDVLVSTTIVESGLDVPNANTIFINNANNFGLSDLHQMRGRVGRTNKKAFCYFITPEYSTMTDDARKRITALEEHTDLGSGFNIAMKDLEIRGAGDLLGGEQSGFINDMGFETYQKILNETIEELKQNEFKDLYKNDKTENYISEVSIDTDFELLFPDSYIKSVNERLQLYSELNKISNIYQLNKFESMLEDRFGNIPFQVEDLLLTVKIKWIAIELGFEKLVMKKGVIKAYFMNDKNSDYFKSSIFTSILNYVNINSDNCKLEEKKSVNGSKLILTVKKITTIDSALLALEVIKN